MAFRFQGALLLASTISLLACAGSPHGAAMDRAQAEFDAGRWEPAAVQLAAIARDPGATEAARHAAELRFAQSLQRLGLRAASAVLLKGITSRPEHAERMAGFDALLPLTLDLPAAAGLEAPLLQFDQEGRELVIGKLPEPAQSRVRLLVGRFEYESKDYPRAIAHLERIKGADVARAQILIAECHVQDRKSVPAAAALEKALTAAATLPAPESGRLTDLANMLMAQLFFSAALKADPKKATVAVDRTKAATALKYWNKIGAQSPHAVEAQWQRAWIELATGEVDAALADARAAAATPGAYVPEAEQIEATVRWGKGDKDAVKAFRAFVTKYTAVRDALKEQIEAFAKDAEPDAAAVLMLERATDHPEALPVTARLAIAAALGDRQIREHLEYARLLDEDSATLESLAALQRDGGAASTRKALDAEKKALTRATAKLVRERLAREVEHLDGLLKDVTDALPP